MICYGNSVIAGIMKNRDNILGLYLRATAGRGGMCMKLKPVGIGLFDLFFRIFFKYSYRSSDFIDHHFINRLADLICFEVGKFFIGNHFENFQIDI